MIYQNLEAGRDRLAKALEFSARNDPNFALCWSEDIQNLLTEADRLREALKFYTDEKGFMISLHNIPTWDDIPREGDDMGKYATCPILEDRGQRAREVLG